MKTLKFNSLTDYVREHSFSVGRASLKDEGWSLVDEQTQTLLNRLQTVGVPLESYINGKSYRGVLTGLNEAFVIDVETKKRLIKKDSKSAELIKPFLLGRDVKRYESPFTSNYLIFVRRGVDLKRYPAIEEHYTVEKQFLLLKENF